MLTCAILPIIKLKTDDHVKSEVSKQLATYADVWQIGMTKNGRNPNRYLNSKPRHLHVANKFSAAQSKTKNNALSE